MATDIGIKELLEAGVHFGHQTRRWNPKMRRFIFGERGGIHIIDLQKTERLLHTAQEFAGELAGRGGTILFVGTKKQARDTIREGAEACGMPYVNQRWLGGLLTNFQTINNASSACTSWRVDRDGLDGPAAGARAHRGMSERDKLRPTWRRGRHARPPTRCSWSTEDRDIGVARPCGSRSRSSGW